jgi:hypothetical protein
LDIVFVMWFKSEGMAGEVPGICGDLVGRNYIFQFSIYFETRYF